MKNNYTNAVEYFEQNPTYEYYKDGLGKVGTRIYYKMKLPQLIVDQWTKKVLGEYPIITSKKKQIELDIKLDKAFSDLLAYGRVVIVPVLVNGAFDYETYNETNCNYIYEDNKLVFLQYIKKEFIGNNFSKIEDVKYIHKIEQEKYIIQRYLKDKLLSEEVINSNELLPNILDLQINNNTSRPIYYNAVNYIYNCDLLFNDMLRDLKLSEKSVLLPGSYLQANSRREGLNGVNQLSTDNPLYQILPDGQGGETKPILWEGNFDPKNKLEAMNFNLHMISLASGFGSKYLSYESNAGLKTAEEVVSDKSDLYITKLNLDKYVKEIILMLLKSKNILLELEDQEYDVTFSDSLITSDEKKAEMYRQDFIAGVISQSVLLDKLIDLGFYTASEKQESLLLEDSVSLKNNVVIEEE